MFKISFNLPIDNLWELGLNSLLGDHGDDWLLEMITEDVDISVYDEAEGTLEAEIRDRTQAP